MLFEFYSEQLQRKRRKTQRAFLLSVVLHVVAIALVSLSYVSWYRPMLSPETLVEDEISLSTIKRLHMSSERKRSTTDEFYKPYQNWNINGRLWNRRRFADSRDFAEC